MFLQLIRAARINHKAGDVVDVTPAEYSFLISVGSGKPYKEPAPAEKETKAAGEAAEEVKKPAAKKKSTTKKVKEQ